MNKEYVCLDNKVLIKDQNGVNSVKEYQDNIDDILIKENVIEEIEKNIVDINNDILELNNSLEKYNSKKTRVINFLSSLIPIFIVIIGPIFIVPSGINLLNLSSSISKIILMFSNLLLVTGFIPSIAVSLALLSSAFVFDKKSILKKRDALLAQLDMLSRYLENEKSNLQDMKNKKTSDIKHDVQTKIVKDKQQLRKIRNLIELFYTCGDKSEKLYKELKTNSLLKEYNLCDESKQIIIDYLEEKGPVLSKKNKI